MENDPKIAKRKSITGNDNILNEQNNDIDNEYKVYIVENKQYHRTRSISYDNKDDAVE